MKKLKYLLFLLSLTPVVTFAKDLYFDEKGNNTTNVIKMEISQEKLNEAKKMGSTNEKIVLGEIKKTVVTTYEKDLAGNIINTYSKVLTPSEELIFKNSKNVHILEDSKLHNLDEVCFVNDYSWVHQTESKKVEISYYISGGKYIIKLQNGWYINPIIHSFDLLGVRWDKEKSTSSYTVDGSQLPYINENYPEVIYNESSSADHIKKFNNGAGLAQNLYDDIHPLMETMNIKSDTDFGTLVYGTYQHAVRDVSLSTANSYVIGSSGLGGVINHSYAHYYDGMGGVYRNLM